MRGVVETQNFSRRELIQAGLLLGAVSLLAGCEGGGASAGLPQPVWPDKEKSRSAEAPIGRGTRVGSLPSNVIPRSAWTNAQPNWSVSKPMNGVTRITVHHDAMNSVGLVSQTGAARRLAGIRADHTGRRDPSTGNHWVDIGYHYIIDPSGRVWQGRPVSIEGAHVANTNDHNLGVMMMGNFDEQQPTPAALDALAAFVASQMRLYRVPRSRVYTHQELKPTACPGRNLQRFMIAARTPSGRLANA